MHERNCRGYASHREAGKTQARSNLLIYVLHVITLAIGQIQNIDQVAEVLTHIRSTIDEAANNCAYVVHTQMQITLGYLGAFTNSHKVLICGIFEAGLSQCHQGGGGTRMDMYKNVSIAGLVTQNTHTHTHNC